MRAVALVTFLAVTLGLLPGCPANGERSDLPGPETVNWNELRREMVQRIEEEGIEDTRVLDALRAVERHSFVSRKHRARSYRLEPLPIEDDQTISDPYIVAVMTEMLELEGHERVLEIGTGSGYQAAILARLVPEVWTMEIREGLAEAADRRLRRLGFDNVNVRCGDGYKGWPKVAPFDAIIVTAAPPEVPEALIDQLAPGGVLVVPVGGRRGQQLILVRRDADGNITREKGPRVIFVPMIEAE